MPFIKGRDRTFKLADPFREHCPPGEFAREIPLLTRIREDAAIEAYYDGPGTSLEMLVPKLREGPEEHEVRVFLRPHLSGNVGFWIGLVALAFHRFVAHPLMKTGKLLV